VLSYILNGETQTMALGARLSSLMFPGAVVLLDGPLGSGKTTLVRGLAHGLGLSEEYDVISPTFALLNIYPTAIPLYHADCYRLSADEAADLDLAGQARNGILAVEWYKNAALSECGALCLALDYRGHGVRQVNILAPRQISDKIKKMMTAS
jgi:tRNA threonylcarbamoyl adenosine modification protein YjeE